MGTTRRGRWRKPRRGDDPTGTVETPDRRCYLPAMNPKDLTSKETERRRGFRPRPFEPAPWLRGGHLQTLGGKLLRPSEAPPVDRVRLDTPDGDFLDLDLGPDPGADRPVVLILHGLEGSSRRAYVRQASRSLLRRGMRPVGMNFRGCGGEPNRRARFYHSGETGDVRHVLDWLRERFPGRRVGSIGFSLGGNVLLKYLGEEASDGAAAVDAAVTVSVPFDLAAGAERLEEGPMGRLYTHYFLRMLREKLRQKASLVSAEIDVEEALEAATLRSFDDAATAPLHGFEDASDYYRRSSSARFLHRVRTPTLLLQSRDDPFLPPSALPLDAIESNPSLTSGLTRKGGHVGFVEGSPWAPRFWAEEQASRFLAHHLDPRPAGRR